MHRAANDLASLLEKQIKNYRQLKGLVLEKRKAIVANDLKKLSEVTSQIELVIASNNRLEIDHTGLVKKLAAALGISEPKPNLIHIARRLEGPVSEKLMELRRNTISAIAEVQRQNRINAEMLRYSANLIDSVVKRLIGPESFEVTYGNTGDLKQRRASASLIDHRV